MKHTRRRTKHVGGVKCDKGFRWDEKQQKCIPLAEFRATRHHRRCPNGYRWDSTINDCVLKAPANEENVPKKSKKKKDLEEPAVPPSPAVPSTVMVFA